jgi:hypothetical protein
VCRQHCFEKGLCITVEPVKYIFTGGSEDGVRIGFINYTPYPKERIDILLRAEKLGYDIAERNGQWSFTIIDDHLSRYYSRKEG